MGRNAEHARYAALHIGGELHRDRFDAAQIIRLIAVLECECEMFQRRRVGHEIVRSVGVEPLLLLFHRIAEAVCDIWSGFEISADIGSLRPMISYILVRRIFHGFVRQVRGPADRRVQPFRVETEPA
jgi:hypothetical protein